MTDLRIAFVLPVHGNAFMAEILSAVADAVASHGVATTVHVGQLEDIDDGSTAFVVIPHEYFLLSAPPPPSLLRRTISFGVEHPGTGSFETSARASELTAAHFEISADSVDELQRRGLRAERFVLGYSARWDLWNGNNRQRSVDLAYLGLAEPDRLAVLASIAPDLAMLRTQILTPPLEPMRGPRSDFLVGEAKWKLLSDSKLLLNLHRESKSAFEWVRALEAMCNGCVVLSEPSTDLGPLVPGEHLLTAERGDLGAMARAAAADEDLRSRIASAAYALCKEALDMSASAAALASAAQSLVSPGNRDSRTHRPLGIGVGRLLATPTAGWLAEPYGLPSGRLPPDRRSSLRDIAASRRRLMLLEQTQSNPRSDADIDLVCVQHAASGSSETTVESIQKSEAPVNIHLAGIGVTPPRIPSDVCVFQRWNVVTSIGVARNALVKQSSAPYVLVLDAGDRVFPGALTKMRQELARDPALAVSYPMAAYGPTSVTNVTFPEPDRLRRSPYLTRGYMVRRSWLNAIGMFAEDPVLECLVDHDFWIRTAPYASKISHIHQISTHLWRTRTHKYIPVDPAEIRELLRARDPGRSRGL